MPIIQSSHAWKRFMFDASLALKPRGREQSSPIYRPKHKIGKKQECQVICGEPCMVGYIREERQGFFGGKDGNASQPMELDSLSVCDSGSPMQECRRRSPKRCKRDAEGCQAEGEGRLRAAKHRTSKQAEAATGAPRPCRRAR